MIISKRRLNQLRKAHPSGLSSQQIADFMRTEGQMKFSVATFRKYVQLGLVSRSSRYRCPGPRGSRGVYPFEALEQVLKVKDDLRSGRTQLGVSGGADTAWRVQCRNAQCALRGVVDILKRSSKRRGGTSASQRSKAKALMGKLQYIMDQMNGIEEQMASFQ